MQNIIVIGGSAGGIEATREIVSRLPADLLAAIFIVIHLNAGTPIVLPSMLRSVSRLPVGTPADGESIEPGKINIAPPNFHLSVELGRIRVWRGPRENRQRPSIDTLFRTAARSFRDRVAGVLLSGSLDDGVAGLQVIKAEGGVVIVQDPADAADLSMPQNALLAVQADYVKPAAEIADVLVQLVGDTWEPAGSENKDLFDLDLEMEIEEEKMSGVPSAYTCPECNGTLWELDEQGLMRFRCRVGHSYSSASMEAAQSESLESALWAALRALEESVSLHMKFAENARARGQESLARRYDAVAKDRNQHADLVRSMLLSRAV